MPGLRRWVEALLRRPLWLFGPVLLTLGGAAALAELLPARYEAFALVRASWTPEDDADARRVGVDLQSRRVRAVRQRLLARSSTDSVLAELSPYRADLDSGTGAAIRLVSAVSVEARGDGLFAVRYAHRDPQMAALVPNRLVELLVEGSDAEAAPPPSEEGLGARLEAARRAVEDAEAALRRVDDGAGRPPERASPSGAETLALDLSAARARATALRGRLAAAEAAARPLPGEPSELEQLRARRAELRQRYTEQHPDVEALDRRIRRLEAETPPQTPPAPSAETEALRQELVAAEREIDDLSRRVAADTATVSGSRRRAASERARLSRALDEARATYETLRREEAEARPAAPAVPASLVRFEKLEPAAVPLRPAFPNRMALLVGGLCLGLVLGLAATAVAEVRDRSVRDADDLAELLEQPVLAEIPLVRGRRDS